MSSACAAPHHPIPVGTYVSDKTPGDQVSVLATQIRFHVKVNDRFVDHVYDYTVESDGRIHLSPQVSSDILLGVPKYQWSWDGKAILQREPKTGESFRFIKKNAER